MAERVAQGLTAFPPEPFVPLAIGWSMYERCKPLIDFTIKYAHIVEKSNDIIELTKHQKEWVEEYKEFAVLIEKSQDSSLSLVGLGISGMIRVLSSSLKYESVTEYLRDIYYCIELTLSDQRPHELGDFTYDYKKANKENNHYYEVTFQEVEKLRDEEYFNKHFEKLMEYYESIKRLY